MGSVRGVRTGDEIKVGIELEFVFLADKAGWRRWLYTQYALNSAKESGLDKYLRSIEKDHSVPDGRELITHPLDYNKETIVDFIDKTHSFIMLTDARIKYYTGHHIHFSVPEYIIKRARIETEKGYRSFFDHTGNYELINPFDKRKLPALIANGRLSGISHSAYDTVMSWDYKEKNWYRVANSVLSLPFIYLSIKSRRDMEFVSGRRNMSWAQTFDRLDSEAILASISMVGVNKGRFASLHFLDKQHYASYKPTVEYRLPKFLTPGQYLTAIMAWRTVHGKYIDLIDRITTGKENGTGSAAFARESAKIFKLARQVVNKEYNLIKEIVGWKPYTRASLKTFAAYKQAYPHINVKQHLSDIWDMFYEGLTNIGE